jgi:hypothetical protein
MSLGVDEQVDAGQHPTVDVHYQMPASQPA